MPMLQTLKLGRLSFFTPSSFVVCGNKRKVGTVVLVKPRAIVGSQRRLLSNFSSKTSKSVSMKEPNAEFRIAKEKTVKGRVVETARIGNDSDCFERMTVQELRTKLRSIGVPAKGCKRDLVSALKNAISSNIDGEDSSTAVEGSLSSIVKSISSEQHAKRTSGSFSNEEHTENVSMAPATSSGKRAKRTAKPSLVKNTSTEVASIGHATKLSIKSKETAGKKSTQVKKKETLPISTVNIGDSDVNIGASDKVDLFESKSEPWTIFAHKKPQKGWKVYNPKTMRPAPLSEDIKNVKLMSWNVNGLRALLKLEAFSALEIAQREDFDILCLQETKLQEKDVEGIKQTLLEGFGNSYWTCSVSKLGYSGAAIISRIPPLSVRYGLGMSDHDSEGRLVTAEFDTFYLLCCYVPNSSDGLKRLSYRVSEWDPSLGNYMKELEKLKPVILTGDLNCAHEEIDIYNPSGNKRSAGFTIEERTSFESNFLNKGFVDTFRKQHPGVVGYTYWGYRHGGRKTNKGWRLDYFLVSEAIADNVHDSYILPDVTGSDHCPIGLVLKL